ncbi:MAG: transporter [Verrucomicrobia bacterium]|nr:MAG: transporter [Verrucomicrobiota bacterium]
MKKILVFSVMAALFAPLAHGAGFGLNAGSARGDALGGAMVGRADDAAAIYYNPAGIVQLPGDQLMAGVSLVTSKTDVRAGGVTTSSDAGWQYPPHTYYTHQVNDQLWLGAGLFSRFGLDTEFPSDWPGRGNGYLAQVQSYTFNPDVALKLNEQLAIAVGVNATWFDLKMQNAAQEIKGDAIGYGFNVGARYTPSEWLALGAAYQSKVTENVDGSDTSGSLELPQEFSFGIAVKPAPQWSVEVGAVYTGWQSYDKLDVDFKNGSKSVISKDWNNAMRYQAGVEYAATKAWMLRAGYAYDETPIPLQTAAYDVPENDRHEFSLGAGYRWSRWVLDLSYTYMMILDRYIPARPADGVLESNFTKGSGQMIGLSLSTKI